MISPELWATARVEKLGQLMIAKSKRIAEGQKTSLKEWFELNATAFSAALTETLARRGTDVHFTYDTPELIAASVFTEKDRKTKNMTDVSYGFGSFFGFIPGGVINLPSAVLNGMLDRKSIRPRGMNATRANEMLNDPQGVGRDKPYPIAGDEPTEEEMRNYAIGPAQDWEVFWAHQRDLKKRGK